MQRLLLIFSLILLVEASQGAFLPLRSAGKAAAPAASAIPVKYPRLRFHHERRGTMGFVYAAVLGPVGYFGVRLFSPHNDLMRYQAARGFKAWGYFILSAAIVVVAAELGDQFPATALDNLWTGF